MGCFARLVVSSGMEKRHERRLLVVPPDDGQKAEKCQHASSECEQEELDRRITSFTTASPDADQEEQRYQRGFEEDVEQNDIPRAEDAQHAGLQDQQQGVIGSTISIDCLPTDGDGKNCQQRGESEQPQAETRPGQG